MMDDTQARLVRMDGELETEMKEEILLALARLGRMADWPRMASAMALQLLAVMGPTIDEFAPWVRNEIQSYILPDESENHIPTNVG